MSLFRRRLMNSQILKFGDWITSDGYCWIDTGILADNRKIVEYQFISSSTSSVTPVGSRTGSDERLYYGEYENSKWRNACKTFSSQYISATTNTLYTVKSIMTSTENSLVVNDTKITTSLSTDYYTNNENIKLLSVGPYSTYHGYSLNSSCKLFYVKIYDENENLLRYFVPCIMANVPGMYDKVQGKFYSNSGTGVLTVVDAIKVQEFDWIYTNGNAIIDTGILADNRKIVEYKFVTSVNLNDIVFIGSRVSQGDNERIYYGYCKSGSTNVYGNAIKTTYTNGVAISTNTPITVKSIMTSAENSIIVNGTKLIHTEFSTDYYTNNQTIRLLTILNGVGYGMNSNQKLYYVKIYDENENLLMNLVPCMAYGITGMYDKVNKEFYTNINSSGDLIVGND